MSVDAVVGRVGGWEGGKVGRRNGKVRVFVSFGGCCWVVFSSSYFLLLLSLSLREAVGRARGQD